jgi:hypothetical protein
VSGSLVETIVGPLAGVIVGVFAQPLRDWLFYHPKLSLNFNPGDGRYVADAPQRRWARISIINCGQIHLRQCQAFISNVEQERNGTWENVDPQFIDPLVVEWAAMPSDTKFKPRDIPRNVEFFINILFSENQNTGEDSLVLTVYDLPERLRELFKQHKRYRITVIVTGDQVKPEVLQVIVTWAGNWKFATSSCPRRLIRARRAHGLGRGKKAEGF